MAEERRSKASSRPYKLTPAVWTNVCTLTLLPWRPEQIVGRVMRNWVVGISFS